MSSDQDAIAPPSLRIALSANGKPSSANTAAAKAARKEALKREKIARAKAAKIAAKRRAKQLAKKAQTKQTSTSTSTTKDKDKAKAKAKVNQKPKSRLTATERAGLTRLAKEARTEKAREIKAARDLEIDSYQKETDSILRQKREIASTARLVSAAEKRRVRPKTTATTQTPPLSAAERRNTKTHAERVAAAKEAVRQHALDISKKESPWEKQKSVRQAQDRAKRDEEKRKEEQLRTSLKLLKASKRLPSSMKQLQRVLDVVDNACPKMGITGLLSGYSPMGGALPLPPPVGTAAAANQSLSDQHNGEPRNNGGSADDDDDDDDDEEEDDANRTAVVGPPSSRPDPMSTFRNDQYRKLMHAQLQKKADTTFNQQNLGRSFTNGLDEELSTISAAMDQNVYSVSLINRHLFSARTDPLPPEVSSSVLDVLKDVQPVSRAFEEEHELRQARPGEKPCAAGDQCMINTLDGLPRNHAKIVAPMTLTVEERARCSSETGETVQPERNGYCKLCLRYMATFLAYTLECEHKTLTGGRTIQTFHNLVDVPGEYMSEHCMVRPGVLPLPIVVFLNKAMFLRADPDGYFRVIQWGYLRPRHKRIRQTATTTQTEVIAKMPPNVVSQRMKPTRHGLAYIYNHNYEAERQRMEEEENKLQQEQERRNAKRAAAAATSSSSTAATTSPSSSSKNVHPPAAPHVW